MVGRLIEYEKIRPRKLVLQKGNSRLLSARELTDAPVNFIPMEQKCPKITSGLLLRNPIFIKQLIENCILRMKPFMLL